MKKIKYPDAEMMAMDLADILASELNDALHNKERVTLVVPGGTTPAPIFDILSSVHLDWARVNVLLTDERWVPETDKRSNTRLLREHLLVDQAAAATLIPLYRDGETLEEALPELAKAIGPLLPIDVLLLGMGQDMHTASLLPKADNLEDAFEANAPLLLPMRSVNVDETRVTLTAPVLRGAMKTHIVYTSKSKNKALKTAHRLRDPILAPISGFLKGSTVHWAP